MRTALARRREEDSMRSVTYSLTMSLDGYVVGPDGGFDWGVPDPAVFRLAIDEVRGLDVHLMGRRLYETMLYWETVDPDTLDEAEREFAEVWNALPKVVFSTTLTEVEGNARLASGGPAEEIERLRLGPGEGDIGIGGATLAAEVAGADLLDEYRVRVCPVLVGGGLPYFAHDKRQVELEHVETRTFDSGVVYLRHRVVR
jgi:dihydrofolate reductase